jgi:hypothetical protein
MEWARLCSNCVNVALSVRLTPRHNRESMDSGRWHRRTSFPHLRSEYGFPREGATMKCHWIARVSLLAAFSFAFVFAPLAHAQDSDYSRVVRLSRTDGQVLVSHPGSDAWEDAMVNLPLQEGDTLATQGGLAEIEFENGATAYLAENSVLQFTQLGFSDGGRVTQLSLTQGVGTFYANLTRQDSFSVVAPTFEVAIPERAEARVDAFRDSASLQVLLGQVSVSTNEGSTTFEKGQTVTIDQGDLQNMDVARLPEPDSFDQWVGAQSETIQSGTTNSLSYISSPNYYGLSDLSIYGSWVSFPGYGNSWRPFRVGFGWTPYSDGNWILDPRLGWIWVSNEPWGWMPYHFGTWLLSPAFGWVWVPGGPAGLRSWQPACVNWVRVGNQVGWVARSPNDRDGAPANIQHGVVTRTGTSTRNRTGSNQIIAGKDVQSVTPLKQPPPGFVSHPAPIAPRFGLGSPVRTIPQPSKADGTVVFDRGTRTFINGNPKSSPAEPAPLPPSNARRGAQQIMVPTPGPDGSQIRRGVLPPVVPAPPSRMPPNSVSPPAHTISAPSASRTGSSPPVLPPAPARPMSPPSPQVPRYAPPPPSPQAPASASQSNSSAHAAAPTPEPARPAPGAAMPRR